MSLLNELEKGIGICHMETRTLPRLLADTLLKISKFSLNLGMIRPVV